MTTTPTLGQRLRYRFDTSMARGPSALIGYLALVTGVMTVLFTLFVVIFGLGPTKHVPHALFNELSHVIDGGTVTADDTSSGVFIISQLLLTFGGIIIFSALVGVLATVIDGRLQELRKGRSLVLERNHTLVLGWSDAIFTVISELAIANESEKGASVVILAEHDKVEMEDAIREKVEELHGMKVVCRTGSPIEPAALKLVAPNEAKSVIVLSPDDPEPDAIVIKTLLAVLRGPDRRKETFHMVAEIQDAANLEAARLVAGDEAILIDKAETVARLIVQTARQSGASAVYTELLDFDGDEIYFRSDPALVGKRYDEILHAYEQCCVIGIKRASADVQLNPAPDTVFADGDEIIAIAEDDAVLASASGTSAGVEKDRIVESRRTPDGPQHTLVLNCNERTPMVVGELDNYVGEGSTVVVVAGDDLDRRGLAKHASNLANLHVEAFEGRTTDRETLESLELERFGQVIVMCPGDEDDAQRADARTLVTMLHLRDLATKRELDFALVSEMLDDRNRMLAQVTQVDDVIVSNQVVSLMLTQISENVALAEVFAELFEADGSEVYMRPASDYVTPGGPVTFATLVASAAARGETAIGYRIAAEASVGSAAGGVVVNPAKTTNYTVAEGDRLIVLAND